MIIRRIYLKNIRSYPEKEIVFSKGTTLISGDIGSGKSTILIAVEFALFGIIGGTSFQDILRRGANEGIISISIEIGNKSIEIERHLKKSTNDSSIKQLPGSITIDGNTTIMTPVELKSKIEEILSYPKSHKNLLYRFSVYTPQESMKQILFEDPETRLDIIRKIFGLDKYKTIKDNISIVSKNLRLNIKILEESSKGIEEDKRYSEEEINKKKQFETILSEKVKILYSENTNNKKTTDNIEKELQKIKELTKIKENLITELNNIKNSKKNIEESNNNITKIRIELENMNLDKKKLDIKISEIKIENEYITEPENIKNNIEKINLELNEKENRRKISENKVSTHKEIMETLKKDILKIENELSRKIEITKNKFSAEDIISYEKKIIEDNKYSMEKIEELRTIISNLKAKEEIYIKTTNDIISLENCPTCKQKISEEHKHKIDSENSDKIKYIENLLIQKNKEYFELEIKKKNIDEKIKNIAKAKEELKLIDLTEKDIEKYKDDISEKNRRFENTKKEIEEHGKILNELLSFDNKEKPILLIKVQELKLLLTRIELRKELINKISSIEDKIKFKTKDIENYSESIKQNQNILKNEEKFKIELDNLLKNEIETNKFLESLRILEKEEQRKIMNINSEISSLKKDIEYTIKKISELKIIIDRKEEELKKIINLKEKNDLITGKLVSIIELIEKNMLLEIHERINSHLSRWFDLMMEDEDISAKVKEDFSPKVIIQGHDADIGSLSGGEKTSLALAYRLSINKVINDIMNGIETKDLIILDEPTDGFSSEQLDKMKDVIDNLHLKQIILVSHESKIESFVENIIRLQKTNHITQVSR